jgi:DNA-directed RNA polymerase specialized sigma24 family protein
VRRERDLDGLGWTEKGNLRLMEKHETATQHDGPSEIDDRLRPLMTADGEQFDAFLQEVIEEYADPLIRKIIGAKLHVSSIEHHDHFDSDAVEDLCQEAIVSLMAYLRTSRQDPADYHIKSFDEFVATVAFNVYNKYLRRKYPQRHKLKRQLYYLLTHRDELALWKESYDRISGFPEWKNVRLAQRHSKALDELGDDEWNFAKSKLNGLPPPRVPLDQLLAGLFEWLDHPLEFDLLVDTVSGLLKIKDQPNQNNFGDGEGGKDSKFGLGLAVEPSDPKRVNLQEVLKRLWEEIKELPIKQRWALLCNLRDEHGDGLINALPLCGIASPQQIARSLEITLEELSELWDQFPLRDAEMGKRLGIGSQQVISLRKSARERLARRMGNLMV